MIDYDAYLERTYGPEPDGTEPEEPMSPEAEEQIVKVCPICRETSDQPEFWQPRCEKAWEEEQARVQPQS